MSDTQFNPLGTSDAPADWVLPAGLQILLKTCFAHFDGSGAAGSYLPTLQILSNSGRTVIEVPQDASVAAGSSVEASWAPFLRSGGAAAAAAGNPPWAFLSRNNTFVCAGTANTKIVPDASSFYTNDSTVFGVLTTGGGDVGIRYLKYGHYRVDLWCYPTGPPGVREFGILDFQTGGILRQQSANLNFVVTTAASSDREATVTYTNLIDVDSADVTVPTVIDIWEIDNVAAGSITMLLGAIIVVQLDAIDSKLNP